jgi:Caspase domain
LISFSTQPGNVALDGTGRNSPFTGALVKQLGASNDDLSAILIAVRNDVMRETRSKQVPWEHSALTGRFYFNPGAEPKLPAPPLAPPAQMSDAERDWNLAKDTTNNAVLEAFIARYKGTFLADLARARLNELKQRKAESQGPAEFSCGATVGFRIFRKEPPRGVGALGDNEKAYVNDGECGLGHIKEIIGGVKGSGRKVRCVAC